MIRPLRSAHRRTFYVLAVIAPVIFVLGLVKREPRPFNVLSVGVTGEWAGIPDRLMTTISREDDADWLYVRLLRVQDVPDLLLYYSARPYSTNPAASGELPQDAVLVCPASASARFRLPAKHGTLVLYSLGHRKVVDQWPVEVKP